MTPSPEPFSLAESDATGAPSQTAGHPPPQNDISPASLLLLGTGPPGETTGAAKGINNHKYARTGKRNRDAVDKKAAKRLKGQREMDEEYIAALWNLFVPKGENVGMKKDRLEKKWMETTHRYALPYATSRDRRYRAGEGPVSQMEGGVSQRQGHLVRSSSSVLGFATYLDESDLGFDDTVGSTSFGLQKQTNFLAHRSN
ncbi:hypothetical protein EDB84DRAFT_1497115 [Lactarius hengduanensis]|nr:hypothetical protein EDB84DRAFT_1497115 [Lactarius hengduanensis]